MTEATVKSGFADESRTTPGGESAKLKRKNVATHFQPTPNYVMISLLLRNNLPNTQPNFPEYRMRHVSLFPVQQLKLLYCEL